MRCMIAGLVIVVFATTPSAARQDDPAGGVRSQIAELLNNARIALNDLRYDRAASMAQSVLQIGDELTDAERVEALQMVVAALFPEEVEFQQREAVRLYLRQLVRLAPDQSLPRLITWSGLDSLWSEIKETTFAFRTEHEAQATIMGGSPQRILALLASQPGTFTMLARFPDGSAVVLDSTRGGVESQLAISALVNNAPVLQTGSYVLEVRGRNLTGSDSMTVQLPVRVTAPGLQLVPVPTSVDSAQLLPERSTPKALNNVLIGVGAGLVTFLAGDLLRANDILDSASIGPAAEIAAGTMVLGGILAAAIDTGRDVPNNIARNRELFEDLAEAQRVARAENERRRAGYAVVFDFEGAR